MNHEPTQYDGLEHMIDKLITQRNDLAAQLAEAYESLGAVQEANTDLKLELADLKAKTEIELEAVGMGT